MLPRPRDLVLLAAAFAIGGDTAIRHSQERPRRDDVVARLVRGSPAAGAADDSAREVDGIELLVASLPRELRGNFTFVHRSRSPHGGLGDREASSIDPDHPRVILFSDDARLALAFTGAPERPGYDVVEAIRFVDERAAFELSRFVLPAAARRDPETARLRGENGLVNPPDCLRCHGADPRPLFDSYPLWPGFYGAASDTFPDDDSERAAYRDFLAHHQHASSGVYSKLLWPAGTAMPPYNDPDGYDPHVTEVSPDALRLSPNARLGIALSQLNRKRIARKLAASPAWPRLRRGLIAVLLGCAPPPLGREEIESVQVATAVENNARLERMGRRPGGVRSRQPETMERGSYGNVAQILYVANALGVSARDFSLAFEDGALSFYDGILGSEHDGRSFFLKDDIALELLRRLAEEEPRFAPYLVIHHLFAAWPFGEKLDLAAAERACPLLLEHGVELPPLTGPLVEDAAAFARPPEEHEPPETPEAPFARCLRCHDGDEAVRVGRPIPFSSSDRLRARLPLRCASSERTLQQEILARMESSGPDRMPPHGDIPTEAERNAMRDWLRSISHQ